jgi:hypothetical protein
MAMLLLDVVSLDDWRAVVMTSLAAAKAGDASARAWLAQYLFGKPVTANPSPLTVVVQQLLGCDPLVGKLARPHIDRMEYPMLDADTGIKEALEAQVATELQALEAQKSTKPDKADESTRSDDSTPS